jgi:hypothetical protein
LEQLLTHPRYRRLSIHREELNEKNWYKTWGFYLDDSDTKEVDDQKGSFKLPSLPERQPGSLIASSSAFPSKLAPGLQPKSQSPKETNDSQKTEDLLIAYQIKSLQMALYPTEKYRLPPTSVSEYGWAWDSSKRQPFDRDLHSSPRPGMGTYVVDRFTETGTHGRKNIHKWYGASPGVCQKSWR